MITYNYTNTVFDPNAKGKLKNYDTVMSIPEDSLIKPEDLKDHIGEVLMFYSPYGDVVSAILTDVENVEISDLANIDHIEQFKSYILQTLGTSPDVIEELEEISK